jgi:hypothetical protein
MSALAKRQARIVADSPTAAAGGGSAQNHLMQFYDIFLWDLALKISILDM